MTPAYGTDDGRNATPDRPCPFFQRGESFSDPPRSASGLEGDPKIGRPRTMVPFEPT